MKENVICSHSYYQCQTHDSMWCGLITLNVKYIYGKSDRVEIVAKEFLNIANQCAVTDK